MSLLMKPWQSAIGWLLLLVAGAPSVQAAVLGAPAPISRVLKMLDEMREKVLHQGSQEQASYDRFSQWANETLASSTRDIIDGKMKIEDLQAEIVKLKASLASRKVDIKQLKTDVDSNLQAQKEAEGVRKQESATYESDKAEAEQCIAALAAAIKTLSGQANKFLQNGIRLSEVKSAGAFQEAQLMSVAADLRRVLQKSVTSQYVSDNDLRAMRQFVDNPSSALSAAQMGQSLNPYGDYAPKSTQIQGVLEGLYATFDEKLKKCNAEEAAAKKAFESLMATKKKELVTLQATLDKQELDSAEEKKNLADTREELDATKTDLEENKRVFQETEATYKEKAAQWSRRSKLGNEEISSIEKAIEILSSKDAFVALSLVQVSQSRRSSSPTAFDKVIVTIDSMIASLRNEEQQDIEHKDRCQRAEDKNSNEKEDLAHSKTSSKEAVAKLEQRREATMQTLREVDADIEDLKANMNHSLKIRNEEHEDFVNSVEENTEAIATIKEAQTALEDFYDRPSSFLDASPKEKASAKAPPGAAWDKGGKYDDQKNMNKVVMAALDNIREDLKKSMDTGKAEDEDSQKKYKEHIAMMAKAIKVTKDKKRVIAKELAELGETLDDKKAALSETKQDEEEAEDMTKALVSDCLWIEKQFDNRRKKRKIEINGLLQAKIHLSNAGDDVEDDSLDMN